MQKTSLFPAVVLVAPQMGENIGAAARSMLNFGLTDLRIVNPRDGWPNPKAVDMSKGAKEVIKNAQVFDTLEEALHDVQCVYASTARIRDMVKPMLSPRKCAEKLQQAYGRGEKTALLFGPERMGLNNDDIALSDAIVVVPVSELYPSLNLAQAVAVLCYEWFCMANDTVEESVDLGDSRVANRKEVADMFEHLEFELDASDFFRVAEKRPKMIRNIRNIFVRAGLTDQDVRTLRGIIRSLAKKQE